MKVLIGIGALAAIPVTGVNLGTTKQLIEGWKSGGSLIKALGRKRVSLIETELTECMNAHFAPFSNEQGMGDIALIVLQMIEDVKATPTDIAQSGLDAGRFCKTLMDGFDGNIHYEDTAPQCLFRAVVTDAFTRLFANKDFVETLTPDLWAQVLQGQMTAEEKAEARHQEQMTHLRQTDEYRGMREAGITQAEIFRLFTRSETMADNKAEAWAQFQAFVETAIRVQADGGRGSNLGDFVDRVLARVAELARSGDYDVASASIDEALAQEEAEFVARKVRLLDAGIEQEVLRGDADAVAKRLVVRVKLFVQDRSEQFEALRSEWLQWYERGRDRGLGVRIGSGDCAGE